MGNFTKHFYEGLATWADGFANENSSKISEGMRKMLDANCEGQLQKEVRDEALYNGKFTDSPLNMIKRLHKSLEDNKKP